MHRALALAGAALLLAFGCRTTAIPPVFPNPIAPGLTEREVEVAILTAVAYRPGPDRISPGMGLIISEMQKNWSKPRHWALEERKPNEIGAGLYIRSHYLSVTITYSATAFTTRIRESSNLGQTKKSIHENALVWVTELDQRIRSALSQAAALKAAQHL